MKKVARLQLRKVKPSVIAACSFSFQLAGRIPAAHDSLKAVAASSMPTYLCILRTLALSYERFNLTVEVLKIQ